MITFSILNMYQQITQFYDNIISLALKKLTSISETTNLLLQIVEIISTFELLNNIYYIYVLKYISYYILVFYLKHSWKIYVVQCAANKIISILKQYSYFIKDLERVFFLGNFPNTPKSVRNKIHLTECNLKKKFSHVLSRFAHYTINSHISLFKTFLLS